MNHSHPVDERAERYQLLTQSLADGIFDWDLSNNHLYLSPAWKAQLGYSPNDIENKLASWEGLLHPDDREQTLLALQHFLDSTATIWDREFRLRHKDGHYLWIHARATALRREYDGCAYRLLGLHSDVSPLHQRRREASDHREIVEAVFHSIPDMFFLLDSDGRIIDCHSGWGAVFYAEPQEFLGRRMDAVLPQSASLGLASAVQEALLTHTLITHEYELPMTEGPRHYEARIRARDDGQRVTVVVRDMTHSRESAQELAVRLRQLASLYRIYQLVQARTPASALAPNVARILVDALPGIRRLHCVVAIDRERFETGSELANGSRLRAPLFDGEHNRGNITLSFAEDFTPGSDEQRFLNGAAQAISLYLRSERDREDVETYRRIVSNTQDQVALIDRDLNYRLVNAAYAARIGVPPEQLVGRSLDEVLGNNFSEKSARQLRQVMEDCKPLQFQQWRQTAAGRNYMNVLYSPYCRDGEAQGVIVSSHDISALQAAHAELRRAAQVFSSTIEAVVMTELDGTITDVNEAFTEITGFQADEAIGRTPALISSRRHDTVYFDGMFEELADSGRWRGEIWNRRSDGQVFPCLMTIATVTDERGAPTGYIGVFSDITAIKEKEQRLETLANHDPLTGLPNRNQLSRMLERNIEAARRNGDPFTVMYIDLDHFKDVNDSMGHNAGDQLLCKATQRLRALLRANDMLARVGGDEFVAVLPNMHSAGNASLIAGKVLDALLQPFQVEGAAVRIAASIGICSYPDDGADANTLLRNADAAMYRAKEGGRADWRCYSPEMTERAARHLQVLSGLRNAIEQGDLSLVYQPQCDLDSGALLGIEAQPRWEHPELGDIPMDEFIAAAEEGGLVRRLDYWALDTVCEQLQRWRGSGIGELRIALNVSSRTLQMTHFIEELAERLERHGVPGTALELELGEAALLGELQAGRDTLQALAALGVAVAVDNFGSGYSSLLHLRKHPIHRLKLDARFARDVDCDADSESVTRAALALGQHLGLQVVAQGIDTPEQGERLRQLGAKSAQGSLFGASLSAQAVEALLP